MTKAQIDLLKAQEANVNADTQNKISENPNIGKTGELIDWQTKDITQGIENKKAQEALTKAQTEAVNLGNYITSNSKEEQISIWYEKLKQTISEAGTAAANNFVAEDTIKERSAMIKAQATGAALDNIIKTTHLS